MNGSSLSAALDYTAANWSEQGLIGFSDVVSPVW